MECETSHAPGTHLLQPGDQPNPEASTPRPSTDRPRTPRVFAAGMVPAVNRRQDGRWAPCRSADLRHRLVSPSSTRFCRPGNAEAAVADAAHAPPPVPRVEQCGRAKAIGGCGSRRRRAGADGPVRQPCRRHGRIPDRLHDVDGDPAGASIAAVPDAGRRSRRPHRGAHADGAVVALADSAFGASMPAVTVSAWGRGPRTLCQPPSPTGRRRSTSLGATRTRQDPLTTARSGLLPAVAPGGFPVSATAWHEPGRPGDKPYEPTALSQRHPDKIEAAELLVARDQQRLAGKAKFVRQQARLAEAPPRRTARVTPAGS